MSLIHIKAEKQQSLTFVYLYYLFRTNFVHLFELVSWMPAKVHHQQANVHPPDPAVETLVVSLSEHWHFLSATSQQCSGAVIWGMCTQLVAQENNTDHGEEMEEDKMEHNGTFIREQ